MTCCRETSARWRAARLAKQNGLAQYQALVADLQGTAEGRPTRQIEIALIADSAFAAAEQPDPEAAMLARLNIVEGIYSEQVGLLVLATDMHVMPADDDPFTSTQGTALLEQVGAYRAATPAARARGVAHLMTGKNLDGTTAGIAYVGSVCESERGCVAERAQLRHHDFSAGDGARAGPQLWRAARRRCRRRLRHAPPPASSCRRRSPATQSSPSAASMSCVPRWMARPA